MSRRAPAVRFRRRFAHLAVLLLAVAAFGAQQWAGSTHWHAPPGATALHEAAGQPVSGEAPTDGRGLPHPDCLLCQAASHAGAAAPPYLGSGLPVVVSRSFIRPSAGAMAEFLPPLSWAWHSRGPPAA